MSSANQTQQQSASEVGGLFDRLKQASTLSFFETVRSTPDSIHSFIEKCVACLQIGKGNKWSDSEIKSVAFICATQMLAEGLTFAELRQKYHIYIDKLDHRSEWVQAKMIQLGWAIEWTKDGEDGKEAAATFTRNGKTTTVSFSMDLARKKGLIKADSQWVKDPPLMLRARVVTRAATMLEASIGAGTTEDTAFSGSDEMDATASIPPASQIAAAKAEVEKSRPASEFPPNTTTSTTAAKKVVTPESMTSAIEFSEQAFAAFAIAPKISTIGQLCQYTRSQLEGRVCGLPKIGKKKAEVIVTDICVKLGEVGFDLKSPSVATEQSGGDSSAEAESATPEARTDASALAAKGDALAKDSDKNHGDNLHGATIAEINQFFAVDPSSKEYARQVAATKCKKTSLHDCTVVECLIILLYLLGRKCEVETVKIDAKADGIHSHAVPVDEAARLVKVMRDRVEKFIAEKAAASGK